MTLRSEDIGPVPEETARIARAALPKGNTYVQMRDILGPIYADRQWPAKAGEGYDAASFRVDWERRIVTCPAGRESVSWSEMTTARGRWSAPTSPPPIVRRARPGRSARARVG